MLSNKNNENKKTRKHLSKPDLGIFCLSLKDFFVFLFLNTGLLQLISVTVFADGCKEKK